MKINIKQHPQYTAQTAQIINDALGCEFEIYYEADEFEYQKIEAIILKVFQLTKKDLLFGTRKYSIIGARQSLAYLAKKYTTMTFNEIGRKLNKNHTTIIYAVKKIQDLLDVNDGFISERIENCINEINQIKEV